MTINSAGCVAYVPFVLFNTWLLDRHNGLKKTSNTINLCVYVTNCINVFLVVFAAALVFLAGVIRPVTIWFPHSKFAIAVIGIAQLLNAIAGPSVRRKR